MLNKTSENYKSWDIDVAEFPRNGSLDEQLRFLIGFAILAPSGHNSQPWKFIISDSQIEVLPDFSRALPQSDTNHRQLYISLGCAVENLLIAADYFSYQTALKLFPNSRHNELAAGISFSKREVEKSSLHHLALSISKRHTNRNKYSHRMPPHDFLEKIKKFSDPNTHVDIIFDKSKKDAIADVVIAAGVAAMENKGFREELSQYIKSNYTSSPLGMPMFGFGMPGPLSLLAPFLLRRMNMNKLSKKQDEMLLKTHTPAFITISTKEDTKKAWVETGQLYERISLEAEREGIKTAPLAAIIQIGEFYKKLQEALRTSFRPQFFSRLGYADKFPPHSPRLSARAVIEEKTF